MKNGYYSPIVVDINNLRLFIYTVKSHLDMMNYFLRLSEVYVFDCFFGQAAHKITVDDFANWSLVLEHENPYQTSYFGLFMADYHITKFVQIFNGAYSKEEKAILKDFEKFECVHIDGKKCDKLRGFAIIAINEELCKDEGEVKENVLIHELSHALYMANKSYKTFINRMYDQTGVAYQTVILPVLANKYNIGYDRIEDEWAAYVLDNSTKLSKFKKYSEIELKRVTDFFNNLLWSHASIVQGDKNNLVQKYLLKINS